jgi:hypothetical protein
MASTIGALVCGRFVGHAGGGVAAAARRGQPVNTGCGAIAEAKWFAA